MNFIDARLGLLVCRIGTGASTRDLVLLPANDAFDQVDTKVFRRALMDPANSVDRPAQAGDDAPADD